EELRSLLEKHSLLVREDGFVLASGQRSKFYFDTKKTTTRPDGATLAGEVIFELVKNFRVDAIGGPAHSAIPLATATAIASHRAGDPLPSFYVREEKKEHGTRNRVEGAFPGQGCRVAVIDDVVTTGESIKKAIDAVEDAGAQVALVMILVDCSGGG